MMNTKLLAIGALGAFALAVPHAPVTAQDGVTGDYKVVTLELNGFTFGELKKLEAQISSWRMSKFKGVASKYGLLYTDAHLPGPREFKSAVDRQHANDATPMGMAGMTFFSEAGVPEVPVNLVVDAITNRMAATGVADNSVRFAIAATCPAGYKLTPCFGAPCRLINPPPGVFPCC
jgi:hypothetical protein